MRRQALAVLATAMAATGATAAVGAAEWIVAPMPAGFIVGYRAIRGGNAVEERVPTGETVADWTRMISVQRFAGAAPLGARGLLERMKTGIVQDCPGATASAIIEGAEHNRRTATMRADCPLNAQTGKPETFFARVVLGANDLHSVQYAFRHVPSAAEAETARAYLATVRLCPAIDPACARQP